MSSVVAPLLHTKVYGAVPPVTLRLMDPELSPKHLASLWVSVVAMAAAGCAMVTEVLNLQPWASVMSTVVAPLLHTKVYGAVPPVTLRLMDPELSPKHLASLWVSVVAMAAAGC